MSRKTTTWEDTGRDCPYCGSEILQRSDKHENGREELMYECGRCAAQWGGRWNLVRAGRRADQLNPNTAKNEIPEPSFVRDATIKPWMWTTFVVMLVVIFGSVIGFRFLRLFIFPLIIGLIAFFIFRLGRDQGWW